MPTTAEIGEGAIRLRTRDFDVEFAWTRFRRIEEDALVLVLVMSGVAGFALPKRALDVASIDALRARVPVR